MKAPYSWIKEFIDINENPKLIEEKLNETGLETTVYKFGEYIENIITAKVISVKKHPEKNKLFICEITDGRKNYQVITGATNVKPNQVVVFAKEGAVIKGKKISSVKFGSFNSQGMLLSLEEIGLEDSSDGIFLLGEDTPIGVDASKLLGLGEDWIFEIEITPNRADALSIKGIAREIGAIFNIKRKDTHIDVNILNELLPEIHVDTDKLNRYRAVILRDINVGMSPIDIQLKLLKSGQSPINNVVDITNYILLQEGQPLHAFDLDKIEGNIIVRQANDGEEFTALDGNNYSLKQEDLVIADQCKVLALAGIIGGENSKVDQNTKNVLLEGANFDPSCIRKTAKRLSIQTDSSYRFERGVDISALKEAQDKAVYLLIKVAKGTPIGENDIYINKYTPKQIVVREKSVERILGEKISKEEISKILNSLEIPSEIIPEKNAVKSTIPAFRAHDLEREIDLIEEIGRIKGLNEIEETYPLISTKNFKKPEWYLFEQKTRQFFMDNSFNEVLTYTFVSQQEYLDLDLQVPKTEILNYILKSQSIMRDNIIISLLQVQRENLRHQIKDLSIFEISSIFFDEYEEIVLGILVSGKLKEGYTYTKEDQQFTTSDNWDFLKLKGVIYNYLKSFGFSNIKLHTDDKPYLNKYESAKIYVNGSQIGFFGKIHPKKADLLKIPKNTYVAQIKLKPVFRTLELQNIENEGYLFDLFKQNSVKIYKPIEKFPPVKRDFAFEADEEFEIEKLLTSIPKTCKFAKKVKLFDIYYLGNGKKSIAVSVEFNADDRSLSDEEVNEFVDDMINALQKNLNVKLRT